ncbi:ATP-dependent DNA helicase RecG [Corynebacterium provencense]|uniref:ATP-dependent DNA helicase RecG n=1 Tax=Corynebacterium provencense TaxID=1737425 RepID=UPI00082A8DB7|nr:ATP-dependent DNA helicase RecG [Corynebacterium provencense]
MLGWDDPRPLSLVIPPERARALAGRPGLATMGQALMNFPVSYVHSSGTGAFTDDGPDAPGEGDRFTCLAEVTGAHVQDNRGRRGPREILSFTFRVGDTVFSSALFGNVRMHVPFVAAGAKLMLSGTLGVWRDQWQLKNPSYITLQPAPPQGGARRTPEEHEAAFGAYGPLATVVEVAGGMRAAQKLLSRPWLPMYRRRPGTTTAEVTAVMDRVLAATGEPSEMLPDHPGAPEWPRLRGRPLISFSRALHEVHQPPEEGPEEARTRLKFNEALGLQIVMALRRSESTARSAPSVVPITADSRYAALTANLPYDLTDTQKAALETIGRAMGPDSGADADAADAAGGDGVTTPMSMLLQGDVGSGKTVVALLAMLRVVDSGLQCAFLAPTEVLASQHADTLTGLLDGLGVTVTLLTGSMSAAERRSALLDTVSGTADIVVGTHAIIQDSVEFFDLGLVVVDEQHRFGVRQRDRLRERAPVDRTPHLLVMTATPIPRTVAMTMFGDLSVCTLTGAPAGRGTVHSFVVPTSRPRWVQRVFEVIREQVAAGHRAYVVVPRIDGEGGVDDVASRLESGPLSGLRIGRLHGRTGDKNQVMEAFAHGELDVLVATTVIEVGLDVPEATVTAVMDAENFGVSQLHQLRGRVGRGAADSWCFLCTGVQEGEPSYGRLEAVARTGDGFELAELDLRTRTEGDVLGETQSGSRARRVTLLSLADDADIVDEARRYAAALVEYDTDLSRALVADIADDDQEYIERS